MSDPIKVALIGNPNTGKTSVFNQLTGLNQKVGNYPGITVEKKTGSSTLTGGQKAKIIDLPGTYSLNTTSLDESVAVEILLNRNNIDFPDVVLVIAEVENLKRNLLLYTQIKDLKIPTLLVINMSDRMEKEGIQIDIPALEASLQTKIVLVSTRKKEGVDELKQAISDYASLSLEPVLDASRIDPPYFERLKTTFPNEDLYKLWLVITQDVNFTPLDKQPLGEELESFKTLSKQRLKQLQHKETALRYQFINGALSKGYTVNRQEATTFQARLDRILTHRIGGYVIFFAILLLIFQTIFDWSSVPMDAIDALFAQLADGTKELLPAGVFTDLLAEGIIAGIGGVVIFIPQIAFLFFFIAVLEETGYMSRVVFLMDKLMRPFGLSGKSVVPLISGTACAIPAVMATRTIESWKERLITILVVPFTTCSARLPVYLIITALVIPEGRFFGLSYQGLTLMGLYLLGFGGALAAAWILHKLLKIKSRSLFVIEMPRYRKPLWSNVFYTVLEKTKSFVFGAGKIILAISVILWFLGSNGISEEFKNAESLVDTRIEQEGLTPYSLNYIQENMNLYAAERNLDLKQVQSGQLAAADLDSIAQFRQLLADNARLQEIASFRLEHSFIGWAGKAIEPVVQPLGYDWKIGIAVITSFAAREVFVGTLATIYSVGSEEEETIKQRMGAELNKKGEPLFNLASGVSLLLFYAFAMQCMSTLAIVKRETNGWKWPMLQLGFMSVIAYLTALIAYQLLQ